MSVLRYKNPDGTWAEIVTIKGDKGDPGPQGPPGEGTKIEIDNQTLVFGDDDKLKVNVTSEAAAGDGRPITSSGVDAIVGTIAGSLDYILYGR